MRAAEIHILVAIMKGFLSLGSASIVRAAQRDHADAVSRSEIR